MITDSHYIAEAEQTRKMFDLELILEIQANHRIEVIVGEDWQPVCYIAGEGWGTALSPMMALSAGVINLKEKHNGDGNPYIT